MNEWINEWKNEWMNEQMNELIICFFAYNKSIDPMVDCWMLIFTDYLIDTKQKTPVNAQVLMISLDK